MLLRNATDVRHGKDPADLIFYQNKLAWMRPRNIELEFLDFIPVYFDANNSGSGRNWPAGKYTIKWVEGVISYNLAGTLWGLGAIGSLPPQRFGGPQVLYSEGTLNWVHGPFPEGRYTSQQQALDAINAMGGQSVDFVHKGGTIAMALLDSNYPDNVNTPFKPKFSLSLTKL